MTAIDLDQVRAILLGFDRDLQRLSHRVDELAELVATLTDCVTTLTTNVTTVAGRTDLALADVEALAGWMQVLNKGSPPPRNQSAAARPVSRHCSPYGRTTTKELRAMPPTNPEPDPRETLLAFGRAIDRATRRLDTAEQRADGFEALLTQLATDVQTLVARADTDKESAPRSWLLADDEDQAVADLEDLTGWLGRVYLRYPGAVLPSCWAWHPAVVEELWWLRQAHREAYSPAARSVQKAGDWHDRSRPGVVTRLQKIARDCDLTHHTDNGDRIQDPPAVPLAGEAGWLARHWVAGGTPLPTTAQLEAARFADQRQSPRRAS